MTTFFKHISQIQELPNYRKQFKASLRKLAGNEEKFYYFEKYPFAEEEAPLLLFGEVPRELLNLIKEKGEGLATGTCLVDEAQALQLTVSKGRIRYAPLAKAIKLTKAEVDVRVTDGPQKGNTLKSKKLEEEYRGEDTQKGWRAKGQPESERTSDKITTKYYSESEKNESELRIDGKGRLVDVNGNPIKGEMGYVTDPKTGKIHGFKSQTEDLPGGKKKTRHHSSPLAGGEVGGAGHVKTDNEGRVVEIDDSSGHYKPDGTLTHQSVQHMKDSGVQLRDDTIVDSEGKTLSEKEIRTMARRRELGLKGVKKQQDKRKQLIDETTQRMKEEGRTEMTDEEKKALKKRNKRLDEQKRFVAENVTGPSNRETKVSLQGKFGLSEEDYDRLKGDIPAINALIEQHTGRKNLLPNTLSTGIMNSRPALNIEIGKLLKSSLTTEQFLQTGGNEKGIDQKSRLTDFIKRAGVTKPSDVKRIEALFDTLESMGGIDKLKELGVDPDLMTLDEQGKVLEGKIDQFDAIDRWGSLDGQVKLIEHLGGNKKLTQLGLDWDLMNIEDKLGVLKGTMSLEDAKQQWPL